MLVIQIPVTPRFGGTGVARCQRFTGQGCTWREGFGDFGPAAGFGRRDPQPVGQHFARLAADFTDLTSV